MPASPPVLKLASGEVDLERRRAVVSGRDVRLTTTEAALLAHLAASPGRAVSRDELLRDVWRYAEGAVSRTVDVAVRRLRAKIEPDPASPVHLLSVHGVGYVFVPAAAPAAGALTRAGAGAPPGDRAAQSEAGARRGEAVPGEAGELADAAEGLIGRASDVAAAWAALRGGARPLTLAGPAGVGKTRLARALVDEARAAGRAARLVDLVAAASADDLGVAVAAALGAPRPTDDAIALALESALGAGLLALDNFEQLPEEAAARVGVWLAAAPGVEVVVTSRRPLGLPGEAVLRVEPLPAADAIALFRRRARRVRADVRLDDDAALGAIVTRLDGLPLAIELAAARVRALSIDELSDRLALPFLRDPAPASPRRATLARALDGSWALLPDEARRALCALSVLPGASFVAIAERLLASVGIADPLAVLETLVDHSLVRVEEGPHGSDAARLSPFVCVTEYAAGRRDEVGATDALPGWIRALADTLEEWARAIPTADGRRALARILAESDNVLALLRRHAEVAPADALRVAWAHQEATNAAGGHPGEVAVMARAVVLAEAHADPATLARLLSRRVFVHDRAGSLAAACVDADRVAALAAADPALRLHHVRAELGRVSALRRAERVREALAALDALVLPPEAAPSFHVFVSSERGLLLTRLGDPLAASGAFEQALALAEAAGDRGRADAALDQLALARVEAGLGAEIEARVRDAIERRRALAADALLSPLWYVLGAIALEAGRLDEARAAFLLEQAAGEARGRVTAVASGHANLGLVALRAGDAAGAADAFRASFARYAAVQPDGVPVAPLVGLALARVGAGEREVRLGLRAGAVPDTRTDAALAELGAAVLARAAGEEGAVARLGAALATPEVAVSVDVRALVRYAAGLFHA